MAWWHKLRFSFSPHKNDSFSSSHETLSSTTEQRIYEQVNSTTFSPLASSASVENQYWSPTNSGVDEDLFWRRLSDSVYQKDVFPATYLEIHNQCYEAYNANPLAFAIIEMTTSFVLGEGLRIAATQTEVQRIIDRFWHHPDNHMDERIYSLCTELSLYGEQFIRFFVNPYDGSVIIRQIDPSLIDEIETDPEDIEKTLRYHKRSTESMMRVASTQPAPTLSFNSHHQESEGTWLIAGEEVVQFAINKVSNACRGKSDLATLLPWLRRYKDWLTDRVRINKYKAAFLWDVSLTGADKKTLDRKRMEYAAAPDPGSVIIHNETEKWSAVEPHIQSNDVSADGRAIRLMIAAGALVPEHFLADGDNGNRATAAEMNLPTMLKFKRRQRVLKYMLRTIIDRVLHEARCAGQLSKDIDFSYDIIFPEIDSMEHTTTAQGMNYLVQALSTAKKQNWISDETAMQLLFTFAGQDIDIHQEQQKMSRLQS